jgi:hypothetical protein
LFPFFITFISFEIAVVGSLFRRAIYFPFKLHILERFLKTDSTSWFLYDANIILGGFEVCICIGAGTELF